jgi:hypothetical protein
MSLSIKELIVKELLELGFNPCKDSVTVDLTADKPCTVIVQDFHKFRVVNLTQHELTVLRRITYNPITLIKG